MDEQALITRINDGDKEAFEYVFLSYYKKLVIFGWKYVKSKAVAEEIVQDVFLRLWEIHPDWEPTTIKSYLYGSVRNGALDYLRHEKVKEKYAGYLQEDNAIYYEAKIGEQKENLRLHKNLQKAIGELPPRCKEIFRLSRDEGLTYREISEVLDISERTVETQISRALDILRKIFAAFLTLTFLN